MLSLLMFSSDIPIQMESVNFLVKFSVLFLRIKDLTVWLLLVDLMIFTFAG